MAAKAEAVLDRHQELGAAAGALPWVAGAQAPEAICCLSSQAVSRGQFRSIAAMTQTGALVGCTVSALFSHRATVPLLP